MTRMIAAAAALALMGQAATFRSGVDAVTVDVSVRDRTRVVTGLRAVDFEVFDNGVRQNVADVSYGKLPIDVTLALDTSFSVTGALLERLRNAVRQLMQDLGPDDRLRLVGFNQRVSEMTGFASGAAQIDDAIRMVTAGGGSSIRDALAVALVSASGPQRRQLIVAFTDGIDSTSFTPPEALIDLAQRTNASVASVLPVHRPNAPVPVRQGDDLLLTLAAETGGTVIRMTSATTRTNSMMLGRMIVTTTGGEARDLTPVFRKVLDDFRSSYVLHYTPAGVARDGFHALDVRIKGKPSLTVRARRGYVVR